MELHVQLAHNEPDGIIIMIFTPYQFIAIPPFKSRLLKVTDLQRESQTIRFVVLVASGSGKCGSPDVNGHQEEPHG